MKKSVWVGCLLLADSLVKFTECINLVTVVSAVNVNSEE